MGIWESILNLSKLILGFMANFGLLGFAIWALVVDPEPLGVDICSMRVNLGHLGVHLWPVGVKFEPMTIDFGPLKIEFRFFAINFGLMTSMLRL